MLGIGLTFSFTYLDCKNITMVQEYCEKQFVDGGCELTMINYTCLSNWMKFDETIKCNYFATFI